MHCATLTRDHPAACPSSSPGHVLRPLWVHHGGPLRQRPRFICWGAEPERGTSPCLCSRPPPAMPALCAEDLPVSVLTPPRQAVFRAPAIPTPIFHIDGSFSSSVGPFFRTGFSDNEGFTNPSHQTPLLVHYISSWICIRPAHTNLRIGPFPLGEVSCDTG